MKVKMICLHVTTLATHLVLQMVVSTHSIQDISYCSQDIEDQRVFAYITKDKSGMFYCHVFMAVSKVNIHTLHSCIL